MTLVEKAKAIEVKETYKGPRAYDEEAVALAIAWAKGTVKKTQVGRSLHLRGNSVECFLAHALREGFRQGMIEEL